MVLTSTFRSSCKCGGMENLTRPWSSDCTVKQLSPAQAENSSLAAGLPSGKEAFTYEDKFLFINKSSQKMNGSFNVWLLIL